MSKINYIHLDISITAWPCLVYEKFICKLIVRLFIEMLTAILEDAGFIAE